MLISSQSLRSVLLSFRYKGLRNSPTLSSFTNRVKGDIYKPSKYYNEGPRKLSILHTRLRHQCSSLNADLSSIICYEFYKKIVNLRFFRRLAKVSHPVSKYNESLLANLVKPVTIRAASNCIFLIFQITNYALLIYLTVYLR
jgi:hypothetical protein